MIEHCKISVPVPESGLEPVLLSDETMACRVAAVRVKMKEKNLDALVIYADLEHGSNFEYLTGFLPRFEEALLVLKSDGKAYMVMGNENLNKVGKARLSAEAIHMPHFSLPNQPMETKNSVAQILAQCDFSTAKKIGLAGWKRFTAKYDDNSALTELPFYIVQALKEICPDASMVNASDIFIGDGGVRSVNNANELAHYEFGAALAGQCMQNAMDALEEGKTEMEAASHLSMYGQRHCVVTIMAAGERFEKANLYPAAKRIARGDRIAMTTGFKGGLQSRSGYAVSCEKELPEAERDYLDRLAKPYYAAVQAWLENIRIGMTGGELYQVIENVFPKSEYHWHLNPGHLCADEEWLSSPIYEKSEEVLQSGMILQIDIIPSVAPFGGVNAESGIALADEKLQKEIETQYPELMARFRARQAYMRDVLGINLPACVLPMSNMTAFYRPFMLDKEKALVCR
ncbi:MAG: M24 family metallopeptidase [Clostridia bacterium]|nr:M24 family metallopeptidase [Clostridia bacterium]